MQITVDVTKSLTDELGKYRLEDAKVLTSQ